MPTINIRLNENLNNDIRERASKWGLDVSAYIRLCLWVVSLIEDREDSNIDKEDLEAAVILSGGKVE